MTLNFDHIMTNAAYGLFTVAIAGFIFSFIGGIIIIVRTSPYSTEVNFMGKLFKKLDKASKATRKIGFQIIVLGVGILFLLILFFAVAASH